MENEDELLNKNYFKTSYNKEDVTKLESFKKWKAEREADGEKVVRCPICWGYEIFVEPTNHDCIMCKGNIVNIVYIHVLKMKSSMIMKVVVAINFAV